MFLGTCTVSETTVRKWLHGAGIERDAEFKRHHADIDQKIIAGVRHRAERLLSHPARRSERRLTKERVSRIISLVGQQANIIVQEADEETGRRLKYASAHARTNIERFPPLSGELIQLRIRKQIPACPSAIVLLLAGRKTATECSRPVRTN
jgi:hypothetical protein